MSEDPSSGLPPGLDIPDTLTATTDTAGQALDSSIQMIPFPFCLSYQGSNWRQTITLMVPRDMARHGFPLVHPQVAWIRERASDPSYFNAEFSIQSVLASWLSAWAAITRRGPQHLSSGTHAVSLGGLSGTIKKSGETASSVWRERTRHLSRSLPSISRGF